MHYLLIQKQNGKLRNPNIDFIRIIGMFAIIIHHILWHGKVLLKFNKYKKLQLLNIKCMWHVSSFGVISGLVSLKAFKFSNLFYLWLESISYSIVFLIIYNEIKNPFFGNLLIQFLFPVGNKIYWYFTAYFGMYPFLPFIHSGISILTKNEIKKSVYFMIGIFIIWASYYKDCFSQINGKSPFSLLIFYIFGEYIGKYHFKRMTKASHRVLVYLITSFIFMTVSIKTYQINFIYSFSQKNIKLQKLFRVGINSFPILLQIFSITIFVAQIKFSKYSSSVISFMAPLIFDIYLIHENPFVRKKYIINSFNSLPENINLSFLYILILKKALLLFIICIIIAYVRNKIFILLKIKKICVFYESIGNKILNFLI